jgi:hypothetical protein
MPLFDTPTPTPTPEQLVAQRIDAALRNAAQAMLTAYSDVRNYVYANPDLTSDEVYAAFQANTVTGLSAEQLGAAARATKAVVNLFQPDTIVDDVPAATISLG